VTAAPRCSVCTRSNAETANFCRHCGASIAPAQTGGEAELAAAEEQAPVLPSAPPTDGQRLFRELCWLCGLPLVVSVVYTIVVRVSAPSALAVTMATATMVAIAFVGAAFNGPSIRSALHLPGRRDVLPVLVVALLAATSLTLAFALIEWLGFTLSDSYLLPYELAGWPTYAAYVDLALVTPVAEEVLYRGLVQSKLEQVISSTEAWIVQAALFSAAHLSPVILVTHFVMGLAFGWMRRRSGTIFPGILLHGAWNAWVVATSA
jgi:uncharacterized protein